MPNLKIKSIPLTEKQVTEQVKGFLEAKGWTYIRLNSGLLRTPDKRFMRVGKVGLPDAVAVYGCYASGYTKTLFLEYKRSSGGKVSKSQSEWHQEALKKKLVVLVVSDFKEFRKQYDTLFGGNGICDDATVPLSMW